MSLSESSIDKLTVRHFWAVSARHKWELVLAMLVPVSNLGISVGVPYFIGRILGTLTQPHDSIKNYVIGLVAVSLASVVLNYVSFKNLFSLQPKVMTELQEEALVALMRRGTSFHNSRVSGKLVSDAIDYAQSYLQLCNAFIIDIISFLAIVLLGVVLVGLHSWLIGLILLLMAAMAIGSGIWFRQRMAPRRKIRKEAGKVVTAHISDTIVNNLTVKTFGNEAYELSRHRSLARTLEKVRSDDWYLVATDGSYRNLALLLFQIAFVLIAVYQIRHNPALLGTSIFAFSYTITISNRLFQVGTMARAIEDSLMLASPITEMLQELPEVQDTPGARELAVTKGAINYNAVSFHYADASAHQHVFKNLDLHIKPGEKVGLVGPSGGGKSTLTRLLLRFEDIQDGSITIDGQDIAKITQTSLRHHIAYVPQEPLLFHRTIAENIAYGNLDADMSAIRNAAKQAYADGFITTLPKGYDTLVGERGVKLSGGQRQRIAIARAILKDAPILVLDEATAALDSESEVVIQKALDKLMEKRTTIVIAHRLSTIQRMDRIVVMSDGKIVEQGSHKELLEQNNLYARLWARQSGGFIED